MRMKARDGAHQGHRKREPLSESMIPLDKGGKRRWSLLSEDEILLYARTYITLRKIDSQKALRESDGSLHEHLRSRGLLGKLGIRKGNRWSCFTDDELIELAEDKIDAHDVTSLKGLRGVAGGLHRQLYERGLLSRISIKSRYWSPYMEEDDEQLIETAQRLIEERGIRSECKLRKTDHALYRELDCRGLSQRLRFVPPQSPWSGKDNGTLLAAAEELIREKGLERPFHIAEHDQQLLNSLRGRKLLKRLSIFGKMDNETILAAAERLIKEEGITAPRQIERHDKKLYNSLRGRGLMRRLSIYRKTGEEASVQQVVDAVCEFST